MIMQTFTIPFAIILSVIFLKIKYRWNHYLSLLFCVAGFSCVIVNDIYLIRKKGDDESKSFSTQAIFGDILVIGGAFLYAT